MNIFAVKKVRFYKKKGLSNYRIAKKLKTDATQIKRWLSYRLANDPVDKLC